MLVLVNFMEFGVIVAPELGVASSHKVGGFQQVVAEITVAGFDQVRVLGLKVTGLALRPDRAGKLGDGGLGIKAVDIANPGDDIGGVNLVNAGIEVRVLGIISNCCSMAFSKTLTCSFKARIEAMETDMAWFTVSFTVLGRR